MTDDHMYVSAVADRILRAKSHDWRVFNPRYVIGWRRKLIGRIYKLLSKVHFSYPMRSRAEWVPARNITPGKKIVGERE